MGVVGLIALGRVGVASDLPADGTGAASQMACDGADRFLRTARIGDHLLLL